MKKRLMKFLMLGGIIVIVACQPRSMEIFIEGSYVNHAENKYGLADDTLTFIKGGGQHYLITRRTGFQPIRDGKPLVKRYKVESLEGDYDPAKGLLNGTTTGQVFRFDRDKGVLLLKQAVYRKIN